MNVSAISPAMTASTAASVVGAAAVPGGNTFAHWMTSHAAVDEGVAAGAANTATAGGAAAPAAAKGESVEQAATTAVPLETASGVLPSRLDGAQVVQGGSSSTASTPSITSTAAITIQPAQELSAGQAAVVQQIVSAVPVVTKDLATASAGSYRERMPAQVSPDADASAAVEAPAAAPGSSASLVTATDRGAMESVAQSKPTSATSDADSVVVASAADGAADGLVDAGTGAVSAAQAIPAGDVSKLGAQGQASAALASAVHETAGKGSAKDKPEHVAPDAIAAAVVPLDPSLIAVAVPVTGAPVQQAMPDQTAAAQGQTSGAVPLRVSTGRDAQTVAAGSDGSQSTKTSSLPDTFAAAMAGSSTAHDSGAHDSGSHAEGSASRVLSVDGGGAPAQRSATALSDGAAASSADASFVYSFAQGAGAATSTLASATSTTGAASSKVSTAAGDVESAPAAQASTPLRHLDISVDDGVLGTVGVRAEMRGGVLHASISGGADVAAAMPELHQFLQRYDIALHTTSFQHTTQTVRVSDGGSFTSAGGGGLQGSGGNAQGNSSTLEHDNGRARSNSGNAPPQQRGSAALEGVNLRNGTSTAAIQGDADLTSSSAYLPQGSTLSIHI